MTIIDEIKDSFKHGTNLTKLIYLNLGVFVLLRIKLLQALLLLPWLNDNQMLEYLQAKEGHYQ